MRTRIRLGALVVLCVVVSVSGSFAQSPEGFIGTWKTKADGGSTAQQTLIAEDRGCGLLMVIVSGVDEAGAPKVNLTYASKFDGKDYPVEIRGSAGIGTIASTLLDDHTIEYSLKTDGRITGAGRRTLSRDGKTLTLTTNGSTRQLVFEKQ